MAAKSSKPKVKAVGRYIVFGDDEEPIVKCYTVSDAILSAKEVRKAIDAAYRAGRVSERNKKG